MTLFITTVFVGWSNDTPPNLTLSICTDKQNYYSTYSQHLTRSTFGHVTASRHTHFWAVSPVVLCRTSVHSHFHICSVQIKFELWLGHSLVILVCVPRIVVLLEDGMY